MTAEFEKLFTVDDQLGLFAFKFLCLICILISNLEKMAFNFNPIQDGRGKKSPLPIFPL